MNHDFAEHPMVWYGAILPLKHHHCYNDCDKTCNDFLTQDSVSSRSSQVRQGQNIVLDHEIIIFRNMFWSQLIHVFADARTLIISIALASHTPNVSVYSKPITQELRHLSPMAGLRGVVKTLQNTHQTMSTLDVDDALTTSIRLP